VCLVRSDFHDSQIFLQTDMEYVHTVWLQIHFSEFVCVCVCACVRACVCTPCTRDCSCADYPVCRLFVHDCTLLMTNYKGGNNVI
jgi:hypothetical protein